mmetsp:Transcript_36873/g.80870  ORF Transcript_36873/g.80870 Transcript_36873/m.80870 type:complete len:87 (-) Transcript_36873:102-362(-)
MHTLQKDFKSTPPILTQLSRPQNLEKDHGISRERVERLLAGNAHHASHRWTQSVLQVGKDPLTRSRDSAKHDCIKCEMPLNCRQRS